MRSLRSVFSLFPNAGASGLLDPQILESRNRFGANRLTPLPREPVWKKFLEKFDEPIIKILLSACLLKIVVDLFSITPSAGGIALGGVLLSLSAAYILRLGTLGFGGPVALVGYMHRDLVERRRWISEADYKEGLTLAQLMPGPLAAQLAMYLGYVHHGAVGATVVGGAFVLPSFLMVVALGWAYLGFGGLAWMQAVFYGVGASVIAIITLSAVKLTRKTLGKDRLLWPLYLVSAAAAIITV